MSISDIPHKNNEKDLKDTAWNIFRKLDNEVGSSNIEHCHWLPSKGPKRVIIKFSKQKDAIEFRYCKKD